VTQSDRLALYDAALKRLQAMGLAYPCFCTRADIAREVAASVSAPHGADGPLYPGTCRLLSVGERAERLAAAAPCWRLDARAAQARTGPLSWHDDRAGAVAVDVTALGDIVLKGKAAPASYHLACVVDDAVLSVTDVVRGADIFASTHAQVLLQAVLALPTPRYHHHPLVVDANGVRLAKRHDAPTLEMVRASGADGRALADQLRAGQLPIGFALLSG
ncbi:MAG: glutamate--tRNA ligase family protein, partial [Sphingomonas sp.]